MSKEDYRTMASLGESLRGRKLGWPCCSASRSRISQLVAAHPITR